MTPPMYCFSETDFNRAWERILNNCLKHGEEIVFGDWDDRKIAKDTVQIIELSGMALRQIIAGQVHKKAPFSDKRLEEYCNQFKPAYLEQVDKMPEKDKPVYTYYDRITRYAKLLNLDEKGTWNQMESMRHDLLKQMETNIKSNRSQAITWYVEKDNDNANPPCLQRIWMRYNGNNQVDVHFHWRSRDAYGAWQSNLVALTRMLYRDVLAPNKCTIARIIDFNDSLHVYERDWEEAREACLDPMLH